MTVPINIPIITTSPPSVKSAKSFNKPEKSEDFEQILKQKTSESSKADNGILQIDQAVKNQPQNDIEPEVKPIKDDIKSEKTAEECKPSTKADECAQPLITGQLAPTIVPPQAVPVLALNSTPIDQTTPEPSAEIAVDLMEEGVKGSRAQGGPVPLFTQSALSSLPEETSSNSIGLDKTSNVLHTERVDQSTGNELKEAKGYDQTLQNPGNGSSKSELKQDSRFESISKTFTSTQDLSKAAEQSKATVAASSIKADKGTNSNQNDQIQMADLDSEMFSSKNSFQQGQSGLVNEKGFTASARKVQEVDVQGNDLPQHEGQQPGVSNANKILTEDIKAVAGVKSFGNTGKTERKMVTEAPPDTPEKTPPESTTGVVTDRLKADPFTGKINEPARLAEAQSTEIMRQIGRQVAGSPNSGSQTIRIQLHPEDLGQIELRISSSSQGTHVSLIADQAGTGKLLETHIAQLKQTLSDAGVQMADVHVGQQAPQQSFRDPQSNQSPQQKSSIYGSKSVLGTDEIAFNRSHSNNSLVDYRI